LKLSGKFQSLWLGLLALTAVVAGIGVDLMEVDAAQYASMGQEMNHHGQWVQLLEHGALYQSRGYPDKPPLVFWAAALGTRVLGATNAGAKIISVLLGLWGIWAIGRWAEELLGHRARWPARAFYGVNIGMGLMLQDVRTDTMLVALVTLAGWKSQVWKRTGAWPDALLAFTFLALGMLAKGPLALMALLAALGGHALWNNDYRILARASFWGGLAWMIILLLPWLWGLYQQWGWNKGVWYYGWTQNFGRITGENPWAQQADYSFVFHNLLWSYLPWITMLPAALFWALRNPNRHRELSAMGLTAWILLMLGLSLSKFQLPHYVYILWPFQALLLTQWWVQSNPLPKSLFMHGLPMKVLGLALSVGVDLTMIRYPMATLIWIVGMIVSWLKGSRQPLYQYSAALLLTLIVLNVCFYPKLMEFQSSSQLGKWAAQKGLSQNLQRLSCRDESVHALHFYTGRIIPEWPPKDLISGRAYVVYSSSHCADSLSREGMSVQVLREMQSIKVTRLTLAFLDPRTRYQQTNTTGIYRIIP
jgi:4-amino-4-deoxy-L-arabinose transferase-like glycosyltransferase